MSTTPGSRLGPYEILSRLGAGGMGEVFRARDTRLDRDVAIKVLPAELSRDAQLKLRFEREARAISQLSHPHICTLYDVGDDYLVMELLEGETLADRIARGPLPLADVLRYGAQIADALDRAHRAGIIHRDLKPGNVMITKAGAKLLDFGLAKAATPPVNPDGATMQREKALTQEGTILGTFQYMAPEQLEAEDADARTDIFALGALLYEMATGRRAFEGKTKTSLIAAIVGAQPRPLSEVMPLSPPALEHVIQKCLEKERDDRWQSAHDVGEELKWIATMPAERKSGAARGGRVAVAAAVILAVALAAMTAAWLRARNAPAPPMAFAILPPHGLTFDGQLLSPDGTVVAFWAWQGNEGGVWIRRLSDVEATRLTTGPYDRPFAWSPDSQWIAYLTAHQGKPQLKKIAVTGGSPEMISSPMSVVHGMGSWAPDGTLLYCPGFGEGLVTLRQDGSERKQVTTLDPKRRESFHGWPQFLSDGKRFLYVVHTIADRKNEIWAGSLDGKVKKLIISADSLVGVARGHLHFVRDGAIYMQPFDEEDLELRGTPRRIVERVAFSEPGFNAGATVGSNGALIYPPVIERRVEFGWYDRSGRLLQKLFDELDTIPRSLSRDGTKVAATKTDHFKGAADIYVIDLARGIRTRLTSGLANYGSPLWSPSGDRIYFQSDRDGPYDLYVQADDGATPAAPLWKSPRDKDLADISPSGDALLVIEATHVRLNDLWYVPVDAPEKRRLIAATEADEVSGTFSPDGQWIAYLSDRSGRYELYARRLEGGRTTQISTSGATGFVWNEDGSELYVRTPDEHRLIIPLTYGPTEITPGKASPHFTPPARDYGIVAARGDRFAIWSIPDPSDYVQRIHYVSAPPLAE